MWLILSLMERNLKCILWPIIPRRPSMSCYRRSNSIVGRLAGSVDDQCAQDRSRSGVFGPPLSKTLVSAEQARGGTEPAAPNSEPPLVFRTNDIGFHVIQNDAGGMHQMLAEVVNSRKVAPSLPSDVSALPRLAEPYF